tara:strand:- start:871 stop:1056 length:186 start_codon:yes stop_codon:yes gene_type:complete
VLAVAVPASAVVEVLAVRLAEQTQAAEQVTDRLAALMAAADRASMADTGPTEATVRLAAVV